MKKTQNDITQLNPELVLQQIIAAWSALQTQQPLVHYISNNVAANYVANVLLAAGASPALVDNPYEAEDFAKISAALNINVGTPNTEQMQAMQRAAEAAQRHAIPWVLDPVGYGTVLTWRSKMVDELLAYQPSIIRGNATEISNLSGHMLQSKGVDSTSSSQNIYRLATGLFAHCEVIAISGASDFILSKEYNCVIRVDGGSYLQPKITATGCALGGLLAAYAGVSNSTIASIAAHVHFAIAGELAYQKTQSVGTFNMAFLDAIYELNAEQIQQYAKFNFLPL